MLENYDWGAASLDEQSAPLDINNIDWSQASLGDEIDWSKASIDNVEEPQVIEYVPSIQTSFEGYGEDGRPDFSNPVWEGYDPSVATQEQKDAVIDRISKDLAFQRDAANKQAYQDWRAAKQFADPVIEPTTFGERYGQYTELDDVARLQRAKSQGEEAVINRASVIKQNYPEISDTDAINQARKDVQGDALDFAVSTTLGLGTAGLGSGYGLMGRMGVQGLANAASEGAGQVAGNLVSGRDVTDEVLQRMALGSAFGVGGELASNVLTSQLRKASGSVEQIGGIKKSINEIKGLQRIQDSIDDLTSIDKLNQIVDGKLDIKQFDKISDELKSLGRGDLVDQLSKLRGSGSMKEKALALGELESADAQNAFKVASDHVDVRTKEVLDNIDARGLLGEILGTDLFEKPSTFSARAISDFGGFGIPEAVRSAKARGMSKEALKDLSKDVDVVLKDQFITASKDLTDPTSKPGWIKGARKSAEDIASVLPKLEAGKKLSDSDLRKLVNASEAFVQTNKAIGQGSDELVRAFALRDASKAADDSISNIVSEQLLGGGVSNIGKKLASGYLGATSGGLNNLLITGSGELLRGLDQIINHLPNKYRQQLVSNAAKMNPEELAKLSQTLSELMGTAGQSTKVARELLDSGLVEDNPVISITEEDVGAPSDLSRLVNMWNDGLLTVDQAKEIYDGLSKDDKAIADKLNKRK